MTDDERFMHLALDICRQGIAAGQTPFGAVIVRDGAVLAAAHNTVWGQTDPTAHAEVVAIRMACRQIGAIDLTGATIYSTTEPCPMCFAAVHWARLSRIVFGARIADAAAFGFRELPVPNATLKQLAGSDLLLTPDLCRAEALAVFREWQAQPDRRPY